jgi:SHS2 domain-containing protein
LKINKFEFFDHTADVGLHVTADGLAPLFELAAAGMMSILVGDVKVQSWKTERIRVEGENLEELLVAWLREILWTFERNRMIFKNFQIEKKGFSGPESGPFFLEAALEGETYSPARHGICKEIKAVTRHGLSVMKTDTGWEARILFDI